MSCCGAGAGALFGPLGAMGLPVWGAMVACSSLIPGEFDAKGAFPADAVEADTNLDTALEETSSVDATPAGTDAAQGDVQDAQLPDIMADDPIVPYRIKLVSQRIVAVTTLADAATGEALIPYVAPHSLHRFGSELRFILHYRGTSPGAFHEALGKIGDDGTFSLVADLGQLPPVVPNPPAASGPGPKDRHLEVECATSLPNGHWLLYARGWADGLPASTTLLQTVELDAAGALTAVVPTKAPSEQPIAFQQLSVSSQKSLEAGKPMAYAGYCDWNAADQAFFYRSQGFTAWVGLRVDAKGMASWVSWSLAPGGLGAADLGQVSPSTVNPLNNDLRDPWYGPPSDTVFPRTGRDRIRSIGKRIFELNVWPNNSNEAAAWGATGRDVSGGDAQIFLLNLMGQANDSDSYGGDMGGLSDGHFNTHVSPAAYYLATFGVAKDGNAAIALGLRTATVVLTETGNGPLASQPRSTVPYLGVWAEATCAAEADGMSCLAERIGPAEPGCWKGACPPLKVTADFPGEIAVTRWGLQPTGLP